jgi:hypothetical protein
LATAPLRLLGRGFAGRARAYRHFHRQEHASREPTAHPSRDAIDAPATTQVRAEPELPAALPQRGPSRSPAAPLWPAASPSVYEDLVGYVLWPGDYAARLWSHGYGDVVNAMLTPAAASAAGPDPAAGLIAGGMCSDQAKELAGKPLARIEETLALTTPAQHAALDQLRAALGQAIDRGTATVCGEAPITQADRFKRMTDGLWTMWDAAILLRAPLQELYDSLTDAQKAKLAAGAATDQGLAQICVDQRSVDWPAARIQRAIGASKAQAVDLETMRVQFSDMAKFLATSCLQGTEPTPMSRLTAVSNRMNALLYVVMNMDPAFNSFYGSLDDAQKKKFDSAR